MGHRGCLIRSVPVGNLTDVELSSGSTSRSIARASLPIIESVGMRRKRVKSYIATVTAANGVTYEYFFFSAARSLREAEDEAHESARQCGGTLVEVTPVWNRETKRAAPEPRPADSTAAHELDRGDRGRRATVRRLIAVAAFTFILSSIAIAAAMVVALRFEGAL